jgi:hypothetical protein
MLKPIFDQPSFDRRAEVHLSRRAEVLAALRASNRRMPELFAHDVLRGRFGIGSGIKGRTV